MLDLIFALAVLAPMQEPPPPVNPTRVEFVCPDHDADDQHELKVIRIEGTNKVVITTLLLGDPPYSDPATQTVEAVLNVQPIAFGQYVATVNAIAGGIKSPDSEESNVFVRAPGGPSKVIVR
jgi:hypothetical protein